MRLTKSKRQAIIDGYLNATEQNMFVPSEFIDWLHGQPEHEAYDWFFSQTDEDAARAHRVDLARRFVSGLRVVVKQSGSSKGRQIKVEERSYPAYVSPTEGRQNGGGYMPFDPSNPEHRDQLRIEGAKVMVSWLERYGAVFDDMNLALCEQISAAQSGRVAIAAE